MAGKPQAVSYPKAHSPSALSQPFPVLGHCRQRTQAQVALQISAFPFPCSEVSVQWGAPPGSVVTHQQSPHTCSQAAFQPHDKGSRSPFLPPMEVSPRRALEQQHGCLGQAQPFWQGQWVIKHLARFPSGANGCYLPDFHPGWLICASCRAGPSISKHSACLGKDPGVLAGFGWFI